MDTPKLFPQEAALCGAAAVIVGAFGAHFLEARLSPGMLDVLEVGVRYHFYHALAILAVSLGVRPGGWNRFFTAACWCWLAGVLLFSGSLYALALSGIGALGAITPFGGTAFIAGWLLLIPAVRS